ncbi:MAG: hypothetical protein JNN01_16080 [Opitutaceae bacterium]|nr:hypothetical protein [Opitutaceae bacterium]
MRARHIRTSCCLLLVITWLLTSICAQPAYQFTTFAGQNTPPGATDGPGANARFYAPTGIVVDSAGNVFVSDSGNGTIRKISPAGVVSTFAGQAGASGINDGTGPDARFQVPAQLTLDHDGNLLVVESSYSGSVRKITADGVVATVVGGPGLSNWQDGPLSWAGFDRPRGLAIDREGTIFVIDTSENTVRKVSTAGFVTTIAGSSVGAGQVDITDGPGERARFNGPTGATLDAAGNLFIADTGNHSIRKITPDGMVSTFAGIPRTPGSVDGTTTTARFNAPKALVFDAAGNLYVADTNNHTIRKISSGGVVTTLAGLALTYGGDDGTGNVARFSSPEGLAIDAAGVLYVADTFNNTVRRVTPSGVVTTLAGRATMASSDGSTEVARFVRPQRVVADTIGTLYVTDGSHTVRKVSPAGVVTTLAGKSGFIGSVDATGADARFNEPQGLAVDTAGNVYVADRENHTIRRISPPEWSPRSPVSPVRPAMPMD